MKGFWTSAALSLGVVLLSVPVFAQSPSGPEQVQPTFSVLVPHPGQQLRGGSRITLLWDLVVDKAFAENVWAEMELFLVDNQGLLLRITPQLGIGARSFEWVVPNINSKSARLVLQCGIEGDGELYNLPQTDTFSIKTRGRPPRQR